jgi:hypothetical protein
MITRRHVLTLAATATGAALLARRVTAETLPEATRAALTESDTVYITPLKANGQESRCHAEVWFVSDANGLFVVTASNAWRAAAVRKGLTRARLWVGEFGEWQKSNDRFRKAPGFDATAKLETTKDVHEQALNAFGKKYTAEWLVWGPRFRDGLADGSRVLLRYEPLAAS